MLVTKVLLGKNILKIIGNNSMEYPLQVSFIENIDKWRNDYSFPLKKNEVDVDIAKTISPLMMQIFDLFKDEDEFIFRIAASYIYVEIYSLYYKLLLASEINDKDWTCKDDIDSPLMRLIRKQYEDYPFVLFATPLPEKRNFRFLASKFKHYIKKMLKPLRTEGANIILCGWNVSTVKVAESLDKPFLKINQSYYMPKKYKEIPAGKKEIQLAQDTANLISKAFENMVDKQIPQEINISFAQSFVGFLMRIQFDYKESQEFLEKAKLASGFTLLTGVGGYQTRALSEACRKRGGTVIGAPHGGGCAGADFHDLTWVEFMTCDKYACFSPKEANDYKKHLLPKINQVEFPVYENVETSLLDVKEFDYSEFDFSKIKNIMHISLGLRGPDVSYGIASDLQNFDLQLKIIDYFLKFKDKKYIFKTRPKSQHIPMNDNHCGYYNDKIEYIHRPLSEVIDRADLFIAEYIGSFALWEVMVLTDKPIILFKHPLPACYQSFWDSIGKRCYIVDQIEDDRNRYNFDIEKLEKLLYRNG